MTYRLVLDPAMIPKLFAYPAHCAPAEDGMIKRTISLQQRRSQQGFSLIVVFSLVAIMAATAAAVLLSSRTDVKVSGRQREATTAFFTAEAGIAYSKQYLANVWDPTSFWTAQLSEAARVQSYDMGNIQVGSGAKLPTLKARHTCTFTNNANDPSGDPKVDQDGKIIVTCTGLALDSTGNTALASSTVQVEVEWGGVSTLKGNYQAMQNQSASGVGHSNTLNPVDMTQAPSSL